MKFSELQLGVEYAIIPAWEYSSKEKKNPASVRRHDVQKGKIVSLEKYTYKVYRSTTPTDPVFEKAPAGSKAVSYIVEFGGNGSNQQPIYSLSRPQDIVAEYTSLESRWFQQELEEKKQQEERERIQREQQEERQRLDEQRKRSESACRETLIHILQNRTLKSHVSFDVSRLRENNEYKEINTVTLDITTFNILLEKVLEAQEQNA